MVRKIPNQWNLSKDKYVFRNLDGEVSGRYIKGFGGSTVGHTYIEISFGAVRIILEIFGVSHGWFLQDSGSDYIWRLISKVIMVGILGNSASNVKGLTQRSAQYASGSQDGLSRQWPSNVCVSVFMAYKIGS